MVVEQELRSCTNFAGMRANACSGGNGSYLAKYYLNGLSAPPSTPLNPATFSVPVIRLAGNYEFRFFRINTSALLATSGVVTVNPAITKVGALYLLPVSAA